MLLLYNSVEGQLSLIFQLTMCYLGVILLLGLIKSLFSLLNSERERFLIACSDCYNFDFFTTKAYVFFEFTPFSNLRLVPLGSSLSVYYLNWGIFSILPSFS